MCCSVAAAAATAALEEPPIPDAVEIENDMVSSTLTNLCGQKVVYSAVVDTAAFKTRQAPFDKAGLGEAVRQTQAAAREAFITAAKRYREWMKAAAAVAAAGQAPKVAAAAAAAAEPNWPAASLAKTIKDGAKLVKKAKDRWEIISEDPSKCTAAEKEVLASTSLKAVPDKRVSLKRFHARVCKRSMWQCAYVCIRLCCCFPVSVSRQRSSCRSGVHRHGGGHG